MCVKKISCFLILFVPFLVSAREISFDGVDYGIEKNDDFRSLVEVSDGYVVAGAGASQMPGLTNYGEFDGRLIKYDKDFNIIWQRSYGDSSSDSFHNVIETKDKGLVVVGETYSIYLDGDTYKAEADAIILKYDKDGNLLWQQSYGGSLCDYFYDVIELSDGCFIAVGHVGSTDIDGIINAGGYDLLLVKYDSMGNVIWQKSYGEECTEYLYDITPLTDGGFIAAGVISVTNGVHTWDSLIVKFDDDGNMIWRQSYGGTGWDFFYGVTVTQDGGFVAVGQSSSTDLEGLSHKGGADAIMVKYDNDGNLVWKKNYGGSSSDNFRKVVATSDGGVIVSGAVASSDIDGITNFGNLDAVIVKYNKDGEVVWNQSYGGNSSDYFYDLLLVSGGFVAVGSTQSTDISGIVVEDEYRDGLLVKISALYNLNKATELIKNGTYNIEQVGSKAKLSLNPNNGYELDEIIVIDSLGDKLNYYEENGYYYIDLYDDITVDVKYKQKFILNPNTGEFMLSLEIISLIIILFCLYFFIRKKINI